MRSPCCLCVWIHFPYELTLLPVSVYPLNLFFIHALRVVSKESRLYVLPNNSCYVFIYVAYNAIVTTNVENYKIHISFYLYAVYFRCFLGIESSYD
jgi:hypothetical protein